MRQAQGIGEHGLHIGRGHVEHGAARQAQKRGAAARLRRQFFEPRAAQPESQGGQFRRGLGARIGGQRFTHLRPVVDQAPVARREQELRLEFA